MNRKLVIILTIALIGLSSFAFCQNNAEEQAVTEDNQMVEAEAEEGQAVDFEESPEMSGLEMFARKIVGSGLVDLFIQGGFVMWPLLVLVIWALATIIWKLVSLSYARTNLNDFLNEIVPLIEEDRYEEALDICENTRGPVAAIIHAGLLKVDKGVEAVEKAIDNAGTVEMAFLEKGFIPISTTINLAPMFGFFGTIVGMIAAFDAIAKAGQVEPTIVASGIKIALITTASGLAIAIPVQFFNNMFLGMVDSIVLDMQRGSEKVVEALVENK